MQIEDLGEEGLAHAGQKIANALQSQKLPSSDVLQSVPVADATSITFKSFEFFNYTTEQQPGQILIDKQLQVALVIRGVKVL